MEKMFCPYCGKPLSDWCDCAKYAQEDEERFMEEYNSDPEVNYGWYQQAIIDMYRRER